MSNDPASPARGQARLPRVVRDLLAALAGRHLGGNALDASSGQVNQNLTIQPDLSCGGFKKSGLGKEAFLESMLMHLTRKKTIVVDMR